MSLSVIPDDTAAVEPAPAPEPVREIPISNQTPVQQDEAAPEPEAPEADPEAIPSKPEVAEEATEPEAAPEPAKGKQSGESEIEIVLRPNSPLNEMHVQDIIEFAERWGLNQEQAQALADSEAQREADLKEYSLDQSDNWFAEIESDPNLGGANLQRTQTRVKQALSHFWDNDFIGMLKESHLGNHPGFVRGLEKLGARLSEPQHIARGPESVQGGPPTWEDLFPNSPRPA